MEKMLSKENCEKLVMFGKSSADYQKLFGKTKMIKSNVISEFTFTVTFPEIFLKVTEKSLKIFRECCKRILYSQ